MFIVGISVRGGDDVSGGIGFFIFRVGGFGVFCF